ncbi:hypothetical protein AAL_08174 [Moelleriella libera RCEF 2490]|uniref:Uncharacterized protein n=1 Tax=Moelleriella libera RCEF 2490 TaxID=1081109 RepID=A0A162IF29_9HYPO|nr:hypothetical protein AAL_08174 [Moelleriella libera RCEF 2490]
METRPQSNELRGPTDKAKSDAALKRGTVSLLETLSTVTPYLSKDMVFVASAYMCALRSGRGPKIGWQIKVDSEFCSKPPSIGSPAVHGRLGASPRGG